MTLCSNSDNKVTLTLSAFSCQLVSPQWPASYFWILAATEQWIALEKDGKSSLLSWAVVDADEQTATLWVEGSIMIESNVNNA